MSVTFGRVAHPPVELKDIPDDVNTAWDDLGPRTIRAICWHRSLGSHTGNDAYFRGEGRTRALTDYGIGVAAQDGQSLAGSLYRWNNPRGNRSPWANGRVSAPYGDGKAFVDRYGIDAVNRDVASVEISGFQGTPLDGKSRETLARLTAYWADQALIPWETFPVVPDEDRSFVVWHREFTIGTGKECPWQVVTDETTAILDRARAIMMEAQTGTGPIELPELPVGMSASLAAKLFNPRNVKYPPTGKAAVFAIGERVSNAWLRQSLATIPAGQAWTAGRWPGVEAIIKRGDGRLVFQFGDGTIQEQAA